MKETIVVTLAGNSLLLLFLVAAIGYPLGRIRFAGSGLGNAAILFVGLAVGAVDERLRLPDFIYVLGLVTFVYTLGLSSAATFWRAFNREGLRDIGLCIGTLTLAALVCRAFAPALGLTPPELAGAFSGAFTNAPGLAGLVETMHARGANDLVANAPVVAYAVAYPTGIVGPMIVMLIARAVARVDLKKEAESLPEWKVSNLKLEPLTIEVTNPAAAGLTQDEVVGTEAPDIIFGRVRTADGQDLLPAGTDRVSLGDLIVAVGPRRALLRLAERVGRVADSQLQTDRSVFDFRRMFVSAPAVVGIPLRELDLPGRDRALVTRVRRGDLEFIPTGSTVLELGDRVRVVARPADMVAVAERFGDSYKSLSEVDLMSLSIGLVLGLLIGLLPIPVPGLPPLRLGLAGGPLVAALILGRLGRTGNLVWTLPYSANLSLRNFGLLLFSAGIGTKAGFDFYRTLSDGRGLNVLAGGALMVAVTGFAMFATGYGVFRIPLNRLFGVYAGTQTQPVVLGFATDRTGNDFAVPRYATLFPVATVVKIVLAQVLLGG